MKKSMEYMILGAKSEFILRKRKPPLFRESGMEKKKMKK